MVSIISVISLCSFEDLTIFDPQNGAKCYPSYCLPFSGINLSRRALLERDKHPTKERMKILKPGANRK